MYIHTCTCVYIRAYMYCAIMFTLLCIGSVINFRYRISLVHVRVLYSNICHHRRKVNEVQVRDFAMMHVHVVAVPIRVFVV